MSMGYANRQEQDLLSRIQSASLCKELGKEELPAAGDRAESFKRFQSAREKFMEAMREEDWRATGRVLPPPAPAKSARYTYDASEREFNPSELQKFALTERKEEGVQEGERGGGERSMEGGVVISNKVYVGAIGSKQHYHDPLASLPQFNQGGEGGGADMVESLLDAPKTLLQSVLSIFGASGEQAPVPFFRAQDVLVDSNPSASKTAEAAAKNPHGSESRSKEPAAAGEQQADPREGEGTLVDVSNYLPLSSLTLLLQALEERVKSSLASNHWC